jgi:hypothetical protein
MGLEDVLAYISATPMERYDEAVPIHHGSLPLGTVWNQTPNKA